MLRISLAALAMLVALAAAYLLLAPPVPIEPLAWQAPPVPGYAGPHAPNTRLAGLHRVSIGNETGPEHVALGPDGKLDAAVASGAILRMAADGTAPEVWVNTGGRVLGFHFDATGRLIAADAYRGLLAIAPDRRIEVLADHVGNDPIRYADAVVVAKNGRMYFTDASRRFGAKAWGGTFAAAVLDTLEHSATGRVLEYDSVTRRTRVLMSDLCFANGVALSADLQDPSGKFPETTRVTETADRLYIQSLHAPALGWIGKAEAGVK